MGGEDNEEAVVSRVKNYLELIEEKYKISFSSFVEERSHVKKRRMSTFIY
jgi:hypothetical protein